MHFSLNVGTVLHEPHTEYTQIINTRLVLENAYLASALLM